MCVYGAWPFGIAAVAAAGIPLDCVTTIHNTPATTAATRLAGQQVWKHNHNNCAAYPGLLYLFAPHEFLDWAGEVEAAL